MSKQESRAAGRPLAEWAEMSAELESELAGDVEHTRSLSAAEARWYHRAAGETGPKVKVTIRLRQWQIDRARQLAQDRGARGYQTVLNEIITAGLLTADANHDDATDG